MVELAIDTSGNLCAAAIFESREGREGSVLSEISQAMERGHAEHLMQIIADVLLASGKQYSDIDRVVSTVGPGSFTGIRVGLATARGIGLGLGADVVGVTTLEAIFHAHGKQCAGPVLVALDAKRGEATYQLFGPQGEEITDPAIAGYENVAAVAHQHKATLLGSAIPHLLPFLREGATCLEPVQTPPIAVVAAMGAKKPVPQSRPEPLYLRQADAKPQSGFAVERK